MTPHGLAHRPVAMGRRGVVTSAHFLASMAGMEMLLAGGNAMDAAVAVGAALSVVEQPMSGLGGIGVMLVEWRGEPGRHVLDFVGRAPQAADPSRMRATDLGLGPRSCVTPGTVGGWASGLARFGSMPLRRVLEPAIQLAEHGTPLTLGSLEMVESGREVVDASSSLRAIVPARTDRPGCLHVQPELARVLHEIADGGADAFYRGDLGRSIVREIEAAGGWLGVADLEAFASEWTTALGVTIGELDVTVPPPPSPAFQCLETLAILAHDAAPAWRWDSADYLHHLIEAIRLAIADRTAYGGHADTPTARLLGRSHVQAQRALIRGGASLTGAGHRGAREDPRADMTTHFACADARGNVVTVTQTIGATYGAGFAVRGIVLNNMLRWMDLAPDSPRRLAPGRKGVTYMTPTHVYRGGVLALSLGTPGGPGIPQTVAQLFLNIARFGMNIQEAIELPRLRVQEDGRVSVETRFPATAVADLRRWGHAIDEIGEWSTVVGAAHSILREPGSDVLQAGADPRRDGSALAC